MSTTIYNTEAHLKALAIAKDLAWANESVTEDGLVVKHVLDDVERRYQDIDVQVVASHEQARTANENYSRAIRELESFRRTVRELAIEVAHENGWCREGLNQALAKLGLDPATARMSARVRIAEQCTRYQWVDVEFDVDDPDDEAAVEEAARSAAEDEYLSGNVDMDDAEVEDADSIDEDEWDVENIEEVSN